MIYDSGRQQGIMLDIGLSVEMKCVGNIWSLLFTYLVTYIHTYYLLHGGESFLRS